MEEKTKKKSILFYPHPLHVEEENHREFLIHEGLFVSKHRASDHTWENRCGKILPRKTTFNILH